MRNLIFLCTVLTLIIPSKARTITVDDDGPADFNNIQAAIDDANDGDTVIVADGTYTGLGNRDIDFFGKAIIIHSAAGPENCIIDCNGDGRGFYFHNGEDANSVLDGFTITNGYSPIGGAILCLDSSPVIRNCNISGNRSESDSGGICFENSSAIITNCTISNNSSTEGGGISCFQSSAVITNCTISDNSAEDEGGGIYCYDGSPTILNCTISANVAKSGGVMYCGGASNPTIANCTISVNSAVGGGAIESVESSFKIINCDITNNSARVGGAILASNSNCLIINCTFTGNSAEDGGGIYCDYSNVTITDCNISGNLATRGAGIYCSGYGRNGTYPVIKNCTITGNMAVRHGGAIFCWESSPTIADCTISGNSGELCAGAIACLESSPRITNCTISGNSAEDGGAIYCQDHSNPTITNCSITSNLATSGGGAMYNFNSSPTITNCTFSKNSTTGGLSAGGGMFNYYSSPTLYNCWFSGNSAGYDGGGMLNEISSPKITKCTFNRNTTKYAGGCGGGMYNRGSSPTITNCSFSANAADGGGGINNGNSNPTLTNCDFSGNSAKYIGGAVRCAANTSGVITNCTFAENSSPKGNALACDSSGQRYPSNLQLTNCILWDGGNEVWNNDSSTISITYSDIQSGYEGVGNIDAAPCFVEPGYWDANDTPDDVNDDFWVEGDYYLLPDSPCIDAGDPNYTIEPNETDLDGNPRIVNDRIDMGAYEFALAIEAVVKIRPNTLNPRGNSKWIICRVALPEDYNVADIDPYSVFLEDEIPADCVWLQDEFAVAKFSRSALRELLADIEPPTTVELLVSGQLTDATPFEGTDTIRLINTPCHRNQNSTRTPTPRTPPKPKERK